MLPRRSSLNRGIFVILCTALGLWCWAISSSNTAFVRSSSPYPTAAVTTTGRPSPLDHNHHPPNASNERLGGGSSSSSSSAVLAALSPEQQHNQTLEQLKHNMTMLKANMSGIGQIINDFNRTMDSAADLPNPHPFSYLINTRSVCSDPDLFLLAYIHTAPDHYKRRMVIRQTWGNPKYYGDTKVRVVFVMGRKPEQSVQDALQFEAEQYHDIVQEDFMDTYKNLTYKGIAALKWISNYCTNAKFVLKSDDDIFVNTFTLLRHLRSLADTDHQGLLMCLVWNRMKVMREGKWKVDREEFKDDYYPTYCSGSAYTMSVDVAVALHNISYYVPFFWVDDFYVTGLLPLKLGTIKHKQFMSTYVLDGKKLVEKFTGPQWFTYVFSHVHDLDAIQSVWRTLVELANGKHRAEVKYALPGQLPNEAAIWKKEREDEARKEKERKKKDEEKKKKKQEEDKKKEEENQKKAKEEIKNPKL